MKISIKVSIITLFTTILVLIGSILIFLDYRTSYTILLTSAQNLIKGSSIYIEQHISNFILPIENRVKVGANIIRHQVILPYDSPLFYAFLRENIIDLPGFSGAFWSDTQGNVYLIERSANNTLYKEKIFTTPHGEFVTSEETDNSGNSIMPATTSPTDFKTTARTWYVETLSSKQCRLSDVYLFYPFGENQATLGTTYACPVYDKTNQYMGILAIDMHLAALADFISKIKITPNTSIVIFDKTRNVIAYNKQQYIPATSLQKVEQLKLPWIEDLLHKYQQSNQTLFVYEFADKKYLALYEPLAISREDNWYLGIVIPLSDVEVGLNVHLMLSSGIAGAILILGIFLAWLAGNAVSRPIIKLTEETSSIKELDVNFVSKLRSHIKEIISMQDAFTAMKKSLHSFARYVPITLVKRLIASGDVAHVGGENRLVTFLFSDISGFTSLSEHMDPTNLMNYLSEYFKPMSRIILQNQGTIDKYMGDAIMAFWNAPLEDANHATNACKSALEMLNMLTTLNANWKVQGYPELTIRIGINTGNAVIGNVGSEDRLSYSAIGDSVNLTNRVEELNKVYKTKIIVSKSTYELVKNAFTFRLLDNVAVRGREEGVLIYELLPQNNIFGEHLDRYNSQFQIAFSYYQQQRWDEALSIFNKLASTYSQDKVASVFIERCAHLKQNPPSNWNGVWRFQ